MKNNNLVIIGIDPDVDASGFAILKGGEMHVFSLRFSELIKTLHEMKNEREDKGEGVRVFVEGGWLNRGNYHLNPHDSKRVIAEKGRAVGRNHQCGLCMLEMLEADGINARAVKPLIKVWKGKGGKITHAELVIFLARNGVHLNKKRTNQEERDAALLAYHYADRPAVFPREIIKNNKKAR